jgi:hypothetical protein
VARYFTLPQAESLLPEVERFLREALFHKSEAEKAHLELEEASDRIRMSGGMRVNPGQFQAARARRDAGVTALKEALERIDEAGAVVKDLDIGLIDFLSRFQDRDVCLCWKLGESGIGFWHGTDEGFQGRKPIDQEFRDGHSAGDPKRLN